jgi:hypothetical protein
MNERAKLPALYAFMFPVAKYLLGPAGMIISAVMFWGVPDRSELFDLSSHSVQKAAFSPTDSQPSEIKLYDNDDYCVTVGDNNSGFDELTKAIRANGRYTVRYSKESALLSDESTLYPVVYEIAVADVIVQSYDDGALTQRAVYTIIFLLSLFLTVGSDYYLRNGFPERMS